MKIVTSFAIAALLAVPATAMAQRSTTTTLPNQPGQSEFSPGHRAKIQGGQAKDYAPGQRMHSRDVRGSNTRRGPGASDFAPGHEPNAFTNQNIRR